MSAVSAILDTFSSVTTWFAGNIDAVEPIFWNAETGLTFVGGLSAVGVAVGVTLLVANWIKDFIHLR